MANVRVGHIRRSFRAVEANKGVEIDIDDGAPVIFVRPPRCGKTALLRMIARLEDIASGPLAIDGAVTDDKPPKDRGIAMVFQTSTIFPHMTVRWHVAFGLTINDASKKRKDRKVAEAARIPQREHPFPDEAGRNAAQPTA